MNARGLLATLLVMALSLLLVFGAAELVVRLAGSGPGELVDTAVQRKVRSRGRGPDWREAGPPGEKAPGSFRILVLSDSFGWGVGVYGEDVWARRLERRLGELDSEVDFQVVNWSRPGWNTTQAWASARRRLDSLEPDLIIVGFTLNDPEPDSRKVREERYEPLTRRSPKAAWSRGLHRRSAFYRLFWERFENRRQRRAFTAYYRELFSGPGWEQCQETLVAIRDAARERSIPMLLVVFPVFDSQLDDSYPYRELHRQISAAAFELQIPTLDLLDTYRGIEGVRLAVTPFTDPHPNELAHRIASDELTIHLAVGELVPAKLPMRRTPSAVERR